MDRWGDGDGTNTGPKKPMGAVARLGMGGFVRPEKGQVEPEGRPKVEVVVSRREQKRQQMPPPPPMLPQSQRMADRAPQGFQPPDWAGVPPAKAFLNVIKTGQIIDRLILSKAATLFGRSPTADVILDHPSLSRQHAAVCHQRMSGRWVLVDLNSAHGTAVDGQQIPKNVPVELREGAKVQFAASSRQYILHLAIETEEVAGAAAEQSNACGVEAMKRSADISPGDSEESQVKRRRGVQWADEAQPNDAIEASGALEQVIGYSDSRDFSTRVGPSPASRDEGRFANVVESRVVGMRPSQEGFRQQPPKPKRPPETEGGRSRPPQPLAKPSLFDWLPPPGNSAKAS